MFLLVRRLLKLDISTINESLCLSQSIPSTFVSFAFVPNCCFAKFNSVVLHRSLVSDILSLEGQLCNLNPPCRNKVMDSDFNFFTSFILSPPVTKSSTTYQLLLFQQPLKTLAHSCQYEHPKLPLI